VRRLLVFLLLLAPVQADDRKALEDYFRLVASLNANWAQEVSIYQEAMNVQSRLAHSKRVKSLTALQEGAQASLERLREAQPPASARPLAERWVAVWEMKSRLYTSGIEMVKTLANVESSGDRRDQRKGAETVMRMLQNAQTLSEQIAKDASSASKATQEFLKSQGLDSSIIE